MAADIAWTALIVGFLAAQLTWPVICALKGRWTLFGFGWLGLLIPFVGLCWTVGAIRLARPDSWWWRKRYSPEKQARAVDRHYPPRPNVFAPSIEQGAA